MLFWIFAIVLAAGIVGVVMLGECCSYHGVYMTACFVTVIAGAVFAFMVVVLIVQYVGVDGQVKSDEVRYDSLVYQCENNFYDNDNDIGKKELVNQIQEWNEDLAWGKEIQRDFWMGIFIPNIYDQFEFIELDALKG